MGITGTGLSASRWAPKTTKTSPGTTTAPSNAPSSQPTTTTNLVGPTSVKVKMSQPKINPKLDNLPGLQTSRWAVSIQQQSTDLGKTVAAAAVPVVGAAAETSKCAANNVRAIDITLKPSKFDWADEESKFDDSSWEAGLTK